MDNGANPGGAALEPIPHTGTHGHDHLSAIVYHSSVSLAPGASSRPLPLVQYLLHLRQRPLNLGQPEGHLHGVIHLHGFRPYFGDMTLWKCDKLPRNVRTQTLTGIRRTCKRLNCLR